MRVRMMVLMVIGIVMVVGLLIVNLCASIVLNTADTADTTGYGHTWVEDHTRSEYMFTDDAGNDFVVDLAARTISRGGIVREIPDVVTLLDALSSAAKDISQEMEAGAR